MKYFLSFLALVFFSVASYGQVTVTANSSCTSSTLTATVVGITGTSTGLSTADDMWSNVLNIGFTFDFYNIAYTQCIIGTNGEIGFSTVNAGNYNTWQIANTLKNTAAGGGGGGGDIYNLIAGPWCDLLVSAGGTVSYSTVGTAPNRKFEVTFCAVHMFSCTTQWTTSQIIIYETTNIAEVHIGHKTFCTGWNGGYAETGVVNKTGSTSTMAPGPPILEDYPNTWNAIPAQAWRFTPNAGGTAYTVASIPYAPIPLATTTVYWYDSATNAYIGSGPSITVNPTTSTTYYAAVLGCQDTTRAYITVAPGGVSGALTLCQGTTASLSVASGGGTWSSTNNAIATVNTNTGLVYGVAGGVTTILYTGAAACAGTFTVTVIQPAPLPPASICLGGTTTVSDSPAGGTWSSSNSAVATIGLTTGTITGVSLGTTNISYDVGAGCISSGPLTVVLLSGITGTTTVCQNSTVTLNDVAPGGTWASANMAVATIGLTTGVVTGVSPGTAIITYTVPGGCYTTTTVTVNPRDPITGVASLCERRANITLSNASTGGVWSSANPTIATVTSATGIVYGVTPGASPSVGVATISYTNSFGCVSTYPVSINPTPPAPGVAPQIACQFWFMGPLTPSGSTYTWWGPGVTAGTTTPPTPSSAVPGIFDFYVTVTSASGCESDSSIETVTITPKPAPPGLSPADTSYCQYFSSPATLNTQVDSGSSSVLNWYDGTGAGLPGSPTPQTTMPTYPGGTPWYVAQTINGCESDSVEMNVDIIYKPSFTISAAPWVCQYDSIQLNYSPLGPPLVGGAYLWTLPAGATALDGGSLTGQTVTVQFDSTGQNDSVYLFASDLGGECYSDTSLFINVIPEPHATAFSKQDVCLDDTVTIALSSRSASAVDFVWNIDNTPLFSSGAATVIAANSNSGGPYTIIWNDTGTHIIQVQSFAEHGCADSPAPDTVNVHALPDASFRITTGSGTLCLEDSVLFSANDSGYQNNYSWTPIHFFDGNNIDKHDVWGMVQSAQSIITLTVTDPFGCVGTSNMQIDPGTCCTVTFPNAFSPNGDGKDDVFRPIPSTANYVYHKFVIQNRWGQTIFEGVNDKAAWDGTFNGVPQDIGVYYYYLKYDCGGNTLEQKGDVTLVR